MARRKLDPAVLAHLEWLGFVKPTGLVVSAPALARAAFSSVVSHATVPSPRVDAGLSPATSTPSQAGGRSRPAAARTSAP